MQNFRKIHSVVPEINCDEPTNEPMNPRTGERFRGTIITWESRRKMKSRDLPKIFLKNRYSSEEP
jgi:hypothetical protein